LTRMQNLHVDDAPIAPETDTTDGREKQNLLDISMLRKPYPLASPLLLTGVKTNPRKEEKMMKSKLGTVIMTGALIATMALPMTATAGPAGRGRARSQGLQTQTRIMDQSRERLRLRDGSCLDPAKAGESTKGKRGNTYGPGDGTGNQGDRPMDGTGYGAPSQR
jgi:hypothetical protein